MNPYTVALYATEEQEKHHAPALTTKTTWCEVIACRLRKGCMPKRFWFSERDLSVVITTMIREDLPSVVLAEVSRDGKQTSWRAITLEETYG